MGDKGGKKDKKKGQNQKAIQHAKDLKEKKDKQPKSALKQGAGFNRQRKEEEEEEQKMNDVFKDLGISLKGEKSDKGEIICYNRTNRKNKQSNWETADLIAF